jgi:hypothetical protein
MLEFEVDVLDDVKDDQKALYKEHEGKYRLDLDAYGEWVKKPVVAKNGELLGKHKKLQEQVAQFSKYEGLSDEAWQQFQDWQAGQQAGGNSPDTATVANGDKSEDIAVIKARLRAEAEASFVRRQKELQAQLAEKEKLYTEIAGKHRTFVSETKLTTLAMESGVFSDRLKPFLKAVGDNFRLSDDDQLVVLDEDGDVTDIKPEKFIADTLRERYPFFFQAKEQGGAGTRGSDGRGKASSLKRSAMSNEQKADYIRQYGAETYNRLPLN